MAGHTLLDVGSGAGTLTCDLAKRLAPGKVTAFEMEEAALQLTRDAVQEASITNVSFVVGDAHQMPFEDNSFDIVHAHQVLQHVHDPVQVLREMRRVCKPGGIVAVRDSDYGGFVWQPASPQLTHWMSLYQQASRANGGEPNAGRYLLKWAQEAGFTDIVATSSTWCYATSASRAWWGGLWADRILESKIADQLLKYQSATREELYAISDAWKTWAADPSAWFSLLHGEILCRK